MCLSLSQGWLRNWQSKCPCGYSVVRAGLNFKSPNTSEDDRVRRQLNPPKDGITSPFPAEAIVERKGCFHEFPTASKLWVGYYIVAERRREGQNIESSMEPKGLLRQDFHCCFLFSGTLWNQRERELRNCSHLHMHFWVSWWWNLRWPFST